MQRTMSMFVLPEGHAQVHAGGSTLSGAAGSTHTADARGVEGLVQGLASLGLSPAGSGWRGHDGGGRSSADGGGGEGSSTDAAVAAQQDEAATQAAWAELEALNGSITARCTEPAAQQWKAGAGQAWSTQRGGWHSPPAEQAAAAARLCAAFMLLLLLPLPQSLDDFSSLRVIAHGPHSTVWEAVPRAAGRPGGCRLLPGPPGSRPPLCPAGSAGLHRAQSE